MTQLKKFLRWRYFVTKALFFFHEFHKFPEKYLCQPNCFKKSASQSEKRILISTTVKLPIRNLNHHLQNISNWKLGIHLWFFGTWSNNASSTSPFNATFIGYFDILLFWYFDILFNKCPHFSQKCFFNSNFQVGQMRFLCHVFFLCQSQKVISLRKSLLKIN